MTKQVTEEDVTQTCEVHGFPLDPEQLEVVTAVVNQILLSASKPAVQEPVAWFYYEEDEFIRMYDSEEKAAAACEKFGGHWRAVYAHPAAPAQSGDPIYQVRVLRSMMRPWIDTEKEFAEKLAKEGRHEMRALYAAPQPSPTAVVLDDDRAGLQSILDAGRNAKPLHEGGVGENTVYLAPEMYASLARTLAQPVEQTRALTELKNIAEAKRFNRDHFDDDTAFADWAQSRARHFLAAQPAQTEQPSPRCPEGGKCTGNCDHCRT